jgi:hypothetical protein
MQHAEPAKLICKIPPPRQLRGGGTLKTLN